ncbi:MAG: VanZ family protein [Firmicutes bacterium]|nr:VanZ family protein [Bacillota bacterium]
MNTILRDKRKLFKIMFVLYVAVLLLITVVRPWNPAYQLFDGKINLTLFTDYKTVLQVGISRFIYLFVGNMFWFVPFGFYQAACKRKPILITVLMGFGLSLFIETMQFILGTGVSEIDDLILNTFGCFIGSITALPFLKNRTISKKE